MPRHSILPLLTVLVIILIGVTWHAGKDVSSEQVQNTPEISTNTNEGLPAPEFSQNKRKPVDKKSLEALKHQIENRMEEHDRKGAEIAEKLDAILPVPIAQLYEDVIAKKLPEYELLFQGWELPQSQINEVLQVIKQREHKTAILTHNSVRFGRSTEEGLKIVREIRTTQESASASIENILGKEKALQLATWEKKRVDVFKRRSQD